jgi:hypothetical protein
MRSAMLCCLMVVVAAGCAAESKHAARQPANSEKKAEMAPAATAESAGSEKGRSSQSSGEGIRRKIIYTGTVNLVVEQFDAVPGRVEALAQRFEAYIARSRVSGSPGSPRLGQWTIRVPAERYDAFLLAARELGEVEEVSSDSQDVTEEYYDVETRIRNKKQEETQLLEILTKRTGKLEEVLQVERELARVRGEVEQMEGRLRVLASLTTMSTVTLEVHEIKGYVPEEAVTYRTRVRRAWEGSLTALAAAAQTLSVVLVALLPWISAVLVPVLVVALVARRLWRARKPG